MRLPVNIMYLLILILCFTMKTNAQDLNSDYNNKYNRYTCQQESFLQMQLQNLRQLHEGAIFILKRYATLEALISAVDHGQKENDAFWIGTASLIPGAGQMINEDYLQGGLLLFISSLSWSTIRQLEFTRKRRQENQELLPFYYSAVILRNGIMTYAMLHATNKSYRTHHDRTAAMWTGMASLVPGAGQAVNGDWWEASALFVSWSAAVILTSYLEEQIFLSGDEGYLVKTPEPSRWSVACLPGGVSLLYTVSW